MATLVELDVDGVLNPSGDFGGERVPFVAPFQARFSVDANLLARLSALGEIVWLTSWGDEAPACFGEHVPATHVLDACDSSAWWKYRALADHLDGRHDVERVVWIDDELERYDPPAVHAHEVRIAPHPLIGLQPSDLRSL